MARLLAIAFVPVAALSVTPAPAVAGVPPWRGEPRAFGLGPANGGVRELRFRYVTRDGWRSHAVLLLPSWYGPRRDPPIPLVICPHGRNTRPEAAARRWLFLPTIGGFAVVIPAGHGRVLALDSWGYPGQIADLARMPLLVRRAVPYLRLRRGHIYAVGVSMGGQEALLLLARHPRLLAGVIAFDPAVDLADRYRELPRIPFGRSIQAEMRREVGGAPARRPGAYRRRSPIAYAREIARSHVPVELWWSVDDRVILDQSARQAGLLYAEVKRLDPRAPVVAHVGAWAHAAEAVWFRRLPVALAEMGLLPESMSRGEPFADRSVGDIAIGAEGTRRRARESVGGAPAMPRGA